MPAPCLDDTDGMRKLRHAGCKTATKLARMRQSKVGMIKVGMIVVRAARALVLAAGLAWPAAAFAASAEEAVVTRVLQAAVTGPSAAARVAPRSFDIPAIAAFVLGTYWTSAPRDDQKDFVAALAQSIGRSLTRRPLSKDPDAFSVTGTRRLSSGETLVTSRLKLANGNIANLHWRLRGSPPLIVDVSVDGRSTAVTRRDDLQARLRVNGGSLSTLVTAMRSGASIDP